LDRGPPLEDRHRTDPRDRDRRRDETSGRSRAPRDRYGDEERRGDADDAPGDEWVADAREAKVERRIVRRHEQRILKLVLTCGAREDRGVRHRALAVEDRSTQRDRPDPVPDTEQRERDRDSRVGPPRETCHQALAETSVPPVM